MSTVDSTRQSITTDMRYGTSAAPECKTGREDQAAQLRYALASAAGSWGREFRLLLTLAGEHGVSLNAETLTFYDVRDLQALQRRIVTAQASRSRAVAGR